MTMNSNVLSKDGAGHEARVRTSLRSTTSVLSIILVLNITAWSLLWNVGQTYHMLISLGVLAYGFGLRHAVDADHIAAIDNITRKLLQEQKDPGRVGLYFSFGHSTIVFSLSLAVSLFVKSVQQSLPHLASMGSWIGTVVSAVFLYLIGMSNLIVFGSLWRTWRQARQNNPSQSASQLTSDLSVFLNTSISAEAEVLAVDEQLWKRGFLNRLLQRPLKLIAYAGQTYFIGLLFGLGFDTATEVGLLGISGSAVNHGMPAVDILVLPLLFAAGMSLIDGLDGVLMMHAYSFAFRKKDTRIIYNLVITGLSVAAAAIVGTVESVHMIVR